MIVQAYDYFLIVWFVLAGLSTTYVAYDQFRNNPEPTVMRWVFVLVTLYMGPFGPWRANVTGRRCFVRAGAVFQVPFLLQRAGTLLVRGLKGAGSGVDEPCPAGQGSPSRAPGAPGLPRPGPARAPHPRPRLQRPPVAADRTSQFPQILLTGTCKIRGKLRVRRAGVVEAGDGQYSVAKVWLSSWH